MVHNVNFTHHCCAIHLYRVSPKLTISQDVSKCHHFCWGNLPESIDIFVQLFDIFSHFSLASIDASSLSAARVE